MRQWQDLFSNISDLKQITENAYHQYEHLIKYLDNEDLHKTDLTVKSPNHNIS
jgi:hypothetical protein